MILRKSGLSEREYKILLRRLLKYIEIIPTENIERNIEEAAEIMKSIDKKDSVFIAAALSCPESKIWSDDKDFDKQNRILILKTPHMESLFRTRRQGVAREKKRNNIV